MNWKATLKSSLYLEVGKSHQRSKHEPLPATRKITQEVKNNYWLEKVDSLIYADEDWKN